MWYFKYIEIIITWRDMKDMFQKYFQFNKFKIWNKEHLQNWILVLFYIKDLMNTFAWYWIMQLANFLESI